MMNTTNTTETREPKEITIQELVAAFQGKYIDVDAPDRYGITIEIRRGTIELGDDGDELWFVSRDGENKVTGSICIDEDSIESVEDYGNGAYMVNFMFDMTSVDISESMF